MKIKIRKTNKAHVCEICKKEIVPSSSCYRYYEKEMNMGIDGDRQGAKHINKYRHIDCNKDMENVLIESCQLTQDEYVKDIMKDLDLDNLYKNERR